MRARIEKVLADEGQLRRAALLVSIAVFAVPLLFVAVTPNALEQPVGVDYLFYRDQAALDANRNQLLDEALLRAGARNVDVLVFARVAEAGRTSI